MICIANENLQYIHWEFNFQNITNKIKASAKLSKLFYLKDTYQKSIPNVCPKEHDAIQREIVWQRTYLVSVAKIKNSNNKKKTTIPILV